jgi:chemotaxis protein MotB
MEGRITRLFALLAVFAFIGLTGCAADALAKENQELKGQNTELQDQLLKERALRLKAEKDLAALRAKPGTPAVATENGFEKIEGVETIQGAGKVTVRVPGDVLFASGQADLKTSSKRALDQIAAVLNSQYKDRAIRIEGYTDTDPIKHSHWTDNLQLSQERAASVLRYLSGKGVATERMHATGFGDTKPLDTKDKSRRVEIVVDQE